MTRYTNYLGHSRRSLSCSSDSFPLFTGLNCSGASTVRLLFLILARLSLLRRFLSTCYRLRLLGLLVAFTPIWVRLLFLILARLSLLRRFLSTCYRLRLFSRLLSSTHRFKLHLNIIILLLFTSPLPPSSA